VLNERSLHQSLITQFLVQKRYVNGEKIFLEKERRRKRKKMYPLGGVEMGLFFLGLHNL
jgi:hypothetical protein